ncbi:MAG: hypothetical protein CVU84_05760 [Firmicutes bacterium HGW-Firmicutes-1]|jgi:ElaB/YqjD/DUF883 family membrane-anchored ribosome-binding protein|nr:MAG: hypothetical protein CVU84_05760 [Firmicutes bacterium HGW-Firmicutes-1]
MKTYKGKIFKVTEEYAIVLADTGEFHAIGIKGKMVVSSEVIYTDYDFVKINRKTKKGFIFSKSAMVASLILVIIFGYIRLVSPSTTYAIVSLDINPSIDIHVDKMLRVTQLDAHNYEGESIINNEYIGMSLSDVVSRIVISAQDKKYLTERNNGILVATSIIKNSEAIKIDKIHSIVTQAIAVSATQKINIYSLEITNADMKASSKENLSIGKYELAKQYGKDTDLVRNTTITDLMKEYKKLKDTINIIIEEQILEPTNIKSNINKGVKKVDEVLDRTVTNEDVNKVVDGVVNEVDSSVKIVVEEVDSVVKEMLNEVDDAVVEIKEDVNHVVEEAVDEMNNAIDVTVDEINDAADSVINEVNQVKDDAVNNVVNGLEQIFK